MSQLLPQQKVACTAHICWSISRMLQKWNHWRMEFAINVCSLSTVSYCTPHDSLPHSDSNRMVADCVDIPEFVHTDTNCAALQEKLHECVPLCLHACVVAWTSLMPQKWDREPSTSDRREHLYQFSSDSDACWTWSSRDWIWCNSAKHAMRAHSDNWKMTAKKFHASNGIDQPYMPQCTVSSSVGTYCNPP